MDKLLAKLAELEMRIVLITGIGLMGLYWLLFFEGGDKIQAEVMTIEGQIQEESIKKVETNKVMKELEDVQKQQAQVKEALNKLYTKYPLSINTTEVNKQLQDIASRTGAKIKQFKPENVVDKELFQVFPVNITFEGSFTEFALYIYNLSKSPTLIKINELNINSGNGRDAKAYEKNKLFMKLELNAMSLPKEKRE